MKDPLTKLQQKTLKAFRLFVREHKRPPSYRDFAALQKIAVGTAWSRLTELVDKGYLRRGPHRANFVFEPPKSPDTVIIHIDQQNTFIRVEAPANLTIIMRKEVLK